ncbi:flagellar assembly peptidoglycan hydrolase FlgJ [Halopseudomonas nanhaiensis]|uniref:flagellar assembly peptidoglycan hydrolase FlgJ n=1 Tax=Halopseudomonas nanhaiensis TaxID=2830842 RepID=UPI001CBA96C7|nr:flagellar assembly peptidoglycan hydrolase FlgJ [Halopseudomonas nanhaiensis]
MNSNSLSYTDLNAMSQMGVGSKANSQENLQRVAKQFESLFMNMMVKSMRQANAGFAEGNPLNTQQTKFYQDMYDNQLTVHLAEKQGVGLADVMMRQLSPNKASPAPVAADVQAQGGQGDQSALLARRRLAISTSYRAVAEQTAATPAPAAAQARAETPAQWQPMRALAGASRPVVSTEQAIAQGAPSTAAAAPARFGSAQEFAEAMLPMARKAAARLGVDPHYLVAQAALETGWGKSVIRESDGSSSHNLFGIKTHNSWNGDSASVMTTEYRDGVKGQERASFRSYESYEQSFDDYVSFLETNGRYKQALGSTANPDQFFRELQRAGYATDPQYASKVSQIARKLMDDPRLATTAGTTDTQGKA